MSRPDGRGAEVIQHVVRDHEPPASARAPSLSPPTKKSLAVRYREGLTCVSVGDWLSCPSVRAENGRPAGFWTTSGSPCRGLLLRGKAGNNLRIGASPLIGQRHRDQPGTGSCRSAAAACADARAGDDLPISKFGMPANKLRAVTVIHLRGQLGAIRHSHCRASGAHRTRLQRETASFACLKSTTNFVRII